MRTIRHSSVSRAVALLLALSLSGCGAGDDDAASTAATPAAAAGTAAPPPAMAKPSLPACELVTAEEMSAIMGTPLRAIPSPDSGNKTECTYMPAEGAATYAMLTLAPGDGEAAMQGLGVAGSIDPALAQTYLGIGDQALMNGQMLNVRTGDDLVQITLSGVDDVPGKSRRVFNTLAAKR